MGCMFYIETAVRRRGNTVLPTLRPDTLTLSAVDQSSITAIEHVRGFGPVIERRPARSRPRPEQRAHTTVVDGETSQMWVLIS